MHAHSRKFISPEELNRESLLRILEEQAEIRFVSVAGVDLMGHETDAKIPVEVFRENIDEFLYGIAVNTDGSSVVLPGIASINNARIDMRADTSVKWWLDQNVDNIDPVTGLPVSTLKIPCFLIHHEKAVDSRSVLKRAVEHFQQEILSLIREYPEAVAPLKISPGDVAAVEITAATELEFWARAEEDNLELEELSTSQELKEQYWARTQGDIRTGLERSLMTMSAYGLSPEMGHKEVGGVKSRVNKNGGARSIMEQLEVDWRFDNAMQAADNELVAKLIIRETFSQLDIDVTFLAKPMEGLAGSGEHHHMGVVLQLTNGAKLNLFSGGEKHFLSRWGYAALMGLLHNYEITAPFIVQSNDAFRRLKKGYEAPICIVASLGRTLEVPSRNRTVLVGLIRDIGDPFATRFELRSPNPHTNTYLAMATMLQSMLDGIKWAVTNEKDEDQLLAELCKEPGEEADYLEKDRMYRSEDDVFTAYSDEERDTLFGRAPASVWENVQSFDRYPDKMSALTAGGVFTPELISSFRMAVTEKWQVELEHRIIPNFIKEIRSLSCLHQSPGNPGDDERWEKVQTLRYQLMLSLDGKPGIFDQIHEAFAAGDDQKASNLQQTMYDAMKELRFSYHDYLVHLLD